MLSDYLTYDETSPTCLRWKVARKGGGKGSSKKPGDVAGVFSGRYAQFWLDGVKWYVHRAVWELHNGDAGEDDVDHKDTDPTNNKIGNLRLVPHAINQRNCKRGKNNTSGINGVSYDKSKDRWVAKWRDLAGADKSKSYTVRKYGEAAKGMAIQARQAAIDELNRSGAGYTDSHGKH
jgi:hypothetical protein